MAGQFCDSADRPFDMFVGAEIRVDGKQNGVFR